jgi:putative inorganic carbon (HCO3(-)) transporter
MPQKPHVVDYEPVARRGTTSSVSEAEANYPTEGIWPQAGSSSTEFDSAVPEKEAASPTPPKTSQRRETILRRGHVLSFAGLFLFTIVVFVRPYEIFPSLTWLSRSAFWIALATIIVFVPAQFMTEGNLTIRPREVNLILLLCLLGLLSIPLATSPDDAWEIFSANLIKIVLMFIVMVNVVRTRFRLMSLLILAIIVASYVSVNAINDYRLGRLEDMGLRIAGSIGGMLENPNDLALYLVSILPIGVGLFLGTHRNPLRILYLLAAVLMAVAIVCTFSRGGFVGLVAALSVLALKFGRKNKPAVVIVGVLCVVMLVTLAPGKYGSRIGSIFGGDATGSADERKGILIRSFIVSLRHPLLGVGMGNFHIYSDHELVSHNSYTQVSAEMGTIAALIYVMFIVTPLRKLRRIEEKTFETRRNSRVYYLSVALQASLIGYMVASFFASVAYLWYIYYLVGYAVCVRRLYEVEASLTGNKKVTD